MADYKRMVSYMYQYENSVKRKNVGYARIEAKNGQCKFTLHMQLLGQLDSIFPTYLIQRDGDNMELIYLGDAVLKNQVMDSKLSANENNIMNTGHSLSEMGGLLLFLNDYIFFATEWDDKPITAKEVLEALKPKDKRNLVKDAKTEEKEVEEVEEAEEAKEEVDVIVVKGAMDEAPPIPKILDEKQEDFKHTLSDAVINKVEGRRTETLEEVIREQVQAPVKESTVVSIPAAEDGAELTAAQEAMLPKYKLPRGWKTIERMQNPHTAALNKIEQAKVEASNPEQESVNIPEKLGQQIERDEHQPVIFLTEASEVGRQDFGRYESVEGMQDADEYAREVGMQDSDECEKDEGMSDSERYEEEEGMRDSGSSEREMEMEQPDHPTAQNFFEHYARIYPFEDNEIILCVKIEPKDIGLLPKENWPLSNNSFLMHGFYCYHHLIFAKMKDRYGCRYILGIPGIYHNRERFMARMFGFESFKSIRKRELRQGDFGYWYLPVNF